MQLAHVGVILDIVPGTSVIIDEVVNQPNTDSDVSYSFSQFIHNSTLQTLSDSISIIKDQALEKGGQVDMFLTTKKKYKPVAKKVKPIPGTLLKDF